MIAGVGLVARDSIRALLHRRLLTGLIVVSLGLTVALSVALARASNSARSAFDVGDSGGTSQESNKLGPQERERLRVTMEGVSSFFQVAFYTAASFGGSLIAMFVFSTAVSDEVRRGTIRLTLSKPISRSQFLLGKYLGGVAVMLGYALIASLAMLSFAATQGLELSPSLRYAPILLFFRQLMLGSVAMLLSLHMHPIVASGLAFFISDRFLVPPNPLYYVLPSYRHFNVTAQIFSGETFDGDHLMILVLYALDFVVLMLIITMWRFNRKEVI